MKFKSVFFALLFLITITCNYGFRCAFDEQDWLAYANRCLAESFDQSADPAIKKVELSVTTDYFMRLRKTYAKDMQEYYSFSMHRLNDFDYLGTTTTGTLHFKTQADDIIVQTYNDHRGDIDTMTTVLDIPVKNMEPERLDSLHEAFTYFKGKGM